jgi:hypothetical protein
MSQFATVVSTHRQPRETAENRAASDSAGRASPQHGTRRHCSQLVFSPALVQYFADLNGRQPPTDNDLATNQ